MGLVVIIDGAAGPMCGWRELRRSLSLVHFALLDEGHGPEELRNRDHDANNQAGKDSRKNNRSKDRHRWLVAGKRIGVADIVRGVVDGADVREANHTDDEKAESHRQNSLNDHI